MAKAADKNFYEGAANSSRLQDPKGVLAEEGGRLRTLQEKISKSMTRLATQPKNGGHPFMFALSAPKPHSLANGFQGDPRKFTTAATDGRQFFWHPDFLEKMNEFEVSVVMMHEGYHVLFNHVRRGQGRNPEVWNWAIDYVVNSVIEKDHEDQQRKGTLWGGNLGEPLPFKTFLEYIDAKIKDLPKNSHSGEGGMIFADKTLYGRGPEDIYDEIMRHIEKSPRKCPACGGIGQKIFGKQPGGKSPGEGDGQGKTKGKGNKAGKGGQPGQGDGQGEHEHSPDGEPCDCGGQHDGQGQGDSPGDGEGSGEGGHSCGTCGGGILPMDHHMQPTIGDDEAKQEALRAAEVVQKMRGMVPSGISEIIGELEKPTLTWQDLIRHATMRKKMDEGNKNDWKRFRRRAMSFPVPQYIPRKHDHKAKVLCMLDTSGSMGMTDMTYGISQLQVLGNDMDVTIVPCDAEPYWKDVTKAKNLGDLKKTKTTGRGGTDFQCFFQDFTKHVGSEFDVVVILTDGFFGTIPEALKPRGMDVVWVVTTPEMPQIPFGRVAPLRSRKK